MVATARVDAIETLEQPLRGVEGAGIMLDRSLLKDIGFERGTKGWNHEVWVYNGNFWIHYGDYDRERWPDSATHVNGTRISRKEFLRLFIEGVKEVCHESHVEYPESW